MGGFDINGVNGSTPILGAGKTGSTENAGFTTNFDFGFEAGTVGDVAKFSSTKPAFNSYDMEQMWKMVGITKPEAMKPLENTMAFASEGAEYGVTYSEDDMNLARFMFENMQIG